MKKRMIDDIIVKVVMLSWLGSIGFMLWPSRISSDWFIKIGMCGVAALVVMCILMAISKLIFLMIKKMKKLILLPFVALFALGCDNKPEATEAADSVKHSYNTYEDQYDEKTSRLIGLTEHLDYLANQLVSIDDQLNDPVMKYKRDEYESLKWSKAIMMEQLNEVQKEIDYLTAGPQIKSSQIKDEGVTKPKMSSSGVGIIFDQKTGDTVAIMYKGKSFVPVKE